MSRNLAFPVFCLLVAHSALCVGGLRAQNQEPVLKSGQSLQLRVTGVPQEDQLALSQIYPIGEDGLIRLPYIEPIRVVGIRPSALAVMIEQAYKKNQIYTRPTANVSTAESDARFVAVLGEVRQPTNVPYRSGMTILDAISACGGFTDFAKMKETKLIRGESARIYDLRKASDGAAIKLEAGDTITVPD